MKRANSTQLARKIITPELSLHRSSGDARKLRLDLSLLRGLGGLSFEQLSLLAGELRVRRFRKRAIVYSGKQAGDTIHMMLSGIARMTSLNSKNERVLLEVLGPGD